MLKKSVICAIPALVLQFVLIGHAIAQTPTRGAAKSGSPSIIAEGRFGQALDARVAAVTVRGHDDLRTPPLTVTCWVKLSQKKDYNILIASETKYSSLHWELFTEAGSGRLAAFTAGMRPDHTRSQVDICDDRWHQVALVFEPTRVRLYVDAKEVADQAVASKGRTGRFEDISIGALLEGGLRCTGLIDDVQILRGAHPITKLAESGAELKKETLGLWTFDKTTAKGFADSSAGLRYAEPTFARRSALELPPRVHDDRLTIELFAKEPEIVTPVGIVVDERDRLLVLESNTHFPPKGYNRHPSDRILWLRDTNNDGQADKFSVFADGFTAAMHLTSHPDGSLYVATRGAIIRLRDKDHDGVADERTTLLRLETKCTYPHNGLFSVAFDWLNRMYISMGENLGDDFKLIGSDGSNVTGGGEGGNIFRATADGGKVERIATGFWNPVQLHFDIFGRLFTVDNDPDSRPPCRLLHIVPGGDYGYRYRNGRAGLHPFTAWNGELPGTLPMVAGTGEAPSGLLTCEFAGWPAEHTGKMLVTSWGDYRIDLFTLERRGASFRADRKPLVTGGDDFRPVAMAAGRNGEVYVTDWVDKSYEVHLKGRVWRIRPKQTPAPEVSAGLQSLDRRERELEARAAATAKPKELAAEATRGVNVRARAAAIGALASAGLSLADPAKLLPAELVEMAASVLPMDDAELKALMSSGNPAVMAAVLNRLSLASDDEAADLALFGLELGEPFLQAATRDALRRAPNALAKIDPAKLTSREQLINVLLAMRAAKSPGVTDKLPKLLDYADERVRFLVTQWIGEERLKHHRETLLTQLQRPGQSSEMFTATMTALALVDGAKFDEANTGGRVYLERILDDAKSPMALKARAIRRLPPDSKSLSLERLRVWLAADDEGVRLEAVRALRSSLDGGRFDLLSAIADDAKRPIGLRAEAISGLTDDRRDTTRSLLLRFADADTGSLRHESLRALLGQTLPASDREMLKRLPQRRDLTQSERELSRVLVQRLLEPSNTESRPAPTDTDAWLKLLDGPADAAVGERIFYHTKVGGCFRCHTVDGRGGQIGPDLSVTPRSTERRKLVESILQPSKEIAPQFFVWQVQTDDGRTFVGTLIHESADGVQTYADAEGKLHSLRRDEIAAKQSQRRSIMPDDIAKTLTLQELRDLLAFLTGAKHP